MLSRTVTGATQPGRLIFWDIVKTMVWNFGDTYLHEVLCSKIQKHPHSAPGVANFLEKICTECYT